jgi:hypothetical protein
MQGHAGVTSDAIAITLELEKRGERAGTMLPEHAFAG